MSNWCGVLFQRDIADLWDGYYIANKSMEDRIKAACEALSDYKATEDYESERFDHERSIRYGFVYETHEQELEYRISAIKRQANDLRVAYLLTLYHQWERGARQWAEKADGGFKPLLKAVQALNIPIHEDLQTLLIAANTIKHNHEKWGRQLQELRPDMLGMYVEYTDSQMVSHFEVTVTDDTLFDFFNVVLLSGPNRQTPEWKDDSIAF